MKHRSVCIKVTQGNQSQNQVNLQLSCPSPGCCLNGSVVQWSLVVNRCSYVGREEEAWQRAAVKWMFVKPRPDSRPHRLDRNKLSRHGRRVVSEAHLRAQAGSVGCELVVVGEQAHHGFMVSHFELVDVGSGWTSIQCRWTVLERRSKADVHLGESMRV